MVFEYHEDAIVIDSRESPTEIDFYQIKTKKSGNYSFGMLTRPKRGKDGNPVRLSSILGKLISNSLKFRDETASLNFVSNAKYNLELKDNNAKSEDLDEIRCNELSDGTRKSLFSKVTAELQVPSIDVNLLDDTLCFKVSDLSIEKHEQLTTHKIAEYIEEEYDVAVKPGLVYRTIFGEVRRKNDLEIIPKSYSELIEKKSISRDEFLQLLKTVSVDKDEHKRLGETIIARLNTENASMEFVVFFKTKWRELEIELITTNRKRLLDDIQAIIKETVKNVSLDKGLIDCIDEVYHKVQEFNLIAKQELYDTGFIKALICKEIYDGE